MPFSRNSVLQRKFLPPLSSKSMGSRVRPKTYLIQPAVPTNSSNLNIAALQGTEKNWGSQKFLDPQQSRPLWGTLPNLKMSTDSRHGNTLKKFHQNRLSHSREIRLFISGTLHRRTNEITATHIWLSPITKKKPMSPGQVFRNVHALKRTETHLFRSGDFSVGLVAVDGNRRNRRIRTKCHFPLVAKFFLSDISSTFHCHQRSGSLCTSSERILATSSKIAE